MEMKQEHKPCETKDSGTLYKIGMFAAMNHVTVKALRFYEEQGLLSPRRNSENGYRDYGPEEVAVLRQIKLLRKLGLPLEEIRALQSGHITVSDAMRRHLVTLEREEESLFFRLDK